MTIETSSKGKNAARIAAALTAFVSFAAAAENCGADACNSASLTS